MKDDFVISDERMNDPNVRYGIVVTLSWVHGLFASLDKGPDGKRDKNLGRVLMDGLYEMREWEQLVMNDQWNELLKRVTKATEPFEKKCLQANRR